MILLKEFKNAIFMRKIRRERKQFPMIFVDIEKDYNDILNKPSFILTLDTLTEYLITEAVIFFIEKEYGLHPHSYFDTPIKLKDSSEKLLYNYITNTISVTQDIYNVQDFNKRYEYSDGEYRKTIDDVLEILDLNINLYFNQLEKANTSIQCQYFKGKNYMKKFILDKLSTTISDYMKQYINNSIVNDIIDDHRDMVLLTY